MEISPEELKRLKEERIEYELGRQRFVEYSLEEIRQVGMELSRCRKQDILELMTELSEKVAETLRKLVPVVG